MFRRNNEERLGSPAPQGEHPPPLIEEQQEETKAAPF